jgi:D-xylulose reductase
LQIEPLAVGIHSVFTLAQVRANYVVAIYGAGPVGLLCMAVAKALGARRVIAIDIQQSRLDFAKSYAADDVFVPGEMKEEESKMDYSRRTAQEMKTQLKIADTGPDGVDTIIEATGAEVCIQMGYFLVKTGGTFVQVGMGSPEVQIPITLLLVKELMLKGSFRCVL